MCKGLPVCFSNGLVTQQQIVPPPTGKEPGEEASTWSKTSKQSRTVNVTSLTHSKETVTYKRLNFKNKQLLTLNLQFSLWNSVLKDLG